MRPPGISKVFNVMCDYIETTTSASLTVIVIFILVLYVTLPCLSWKRMLAPSLEVLRWLQALLLSYELHLVRKNILNGLEADKCHQEYHLHADRFQNIIVLLILYITNSIIFSSIVFNASTSLWPWTVPAPLGTRSSCSTVSLSPLSSAKFVSVFFTCRGW